MITKDHFDSCDAEREFHFFIQVDIFLSLKSDIQSIEKQIDKFYIFGHNVIMNKSGSSGRELALSIVDVHDLGVNTIDEYRFYQRGRRTISNSSLV